MSKGQEAFLYLSVRSRMSIPMIYDHTAKGEHGTPTREKIKKKIFNTEIIKGGLIILIIQSNTLENCISSS
jgi:hypothetical protein